MLCIKQEIKSMVQDTLQKNLYLLTFNFNKINNIKYFHNGKC
jgi:hypothetical protein